MKVSKTIFYLLLPIFITAFLLGACLLFTNYTSVELVKSLVKEIGLIVLVFSIYNVIMLNVAYIFKRFRQRAIVSFVPIIIILMSVFHLNYQYLLLAIPFCMSNLFWILSRRYYQYSDNKQLQRQQNLN